MKQFIKKGANLTQKDANLTHFLQKKGAELTQNGADLAQKGADLTHFCLKKGADLTQKGADLTKSLKSRDAITYKNIMYQLI